MFRRLLVGICCAAFLTGQPPALAADSEIADPQQQTAEPRQELDRHEAQAKPSMDEQKETPTSEKIEFSGYTQSRYTDLQDSRGTLAISRARLKIKGQVTDRDKVTVQIDANSKSDEISLRHAYLDHLVGSREGSYLRLGQTKVPIMYDVLDSSSTRLAPERTAVARAVFRSVYDTGMLFHFAPEPQRAALWVGAVTGQGRNSDDKNGDKNALARVLFPTRNGSAYVGYYRGNFVDSNGVTTDKNVSAVGTRQTVGGADLRAEYLIGENLGNDVAGWYVQAALPFSNGVDTFYVRYDTYDENRNAGDTTFVRTTIGIEHKLGSMSRVTLSMEFGDPDAGFQNLAGDSQATGKNVFTAQYQVKY